MEPQLRRIPWLRRSDGGGPHDGDAMPGSPFSLCQCAERGWQPGRTHRTVGSSRRTVRALGPRHFLSLPREPARRCGPSTRGAAGWHRAEPQWRAKAQSLCKPEQLAPRQARPVRRGRATGHGPLASATSSQGERGSSVREAGTRLGTRRVHASTASRVFPSPPHVTANSHGVNWKISEKTYFQRSQLEGMDRQLWSFCSF